MRWPGASNPIKHFTAKLLVLLEVCDYKPVTNEVHGDRRAPIPSLPTHDQLSTHRHHANTPRQSRVPSPILPGPIAIHQPATPAPASPFVPATVPANISQPLHNAPMPL
jgi:hypothetical protein